MRETIMSVRRQISMRPALLGVLLMALLPFGGCDRSLGPPNDFVAARVDSVWVPSNQSATERLRVYVDGRFEPEACAQIVDASDIYRNDSLFVRLTAERSRTCTDSNRVFRHTLMIATEPARTLTVYADGLMQNGFKVLVLQLPVSP